MKKLPILFQLLITLIVLNSSGQSITGQFNLNAYRFIEINPPTKASDKTTITRGDLQITGLMEELFEENGFFIVPRDSTGRTPTFGGAFSMPEEVQLNPCLNLLWYWGFSQSDKTRQTLKVMAVNCHDEIVFENSIRIAQSTPTNNAIRSVLIPLWNTTYQYDEQLNYKLFIPKVNTSNETEDTLREYYRSHDLKPLEGFYKSVNTNSVYDAANYKLAIKFNKDRYQIIVLETDNDIWKPGEIKGYIEQSENTSLQSATFYLSDKRKTEGYAELSDIMLTISLSLKSKDFKNGQLIETSKITEVKFIKIFSK